MRNTALHFLCFLAVSSALFFAPGALRAREDEPEQTAEEQSQPKNDPPRKHFVGLHAVSSLFSNYDERVSPVASHSPDWGGALHYEFRGEKNHHLVSLKMGAGKPLSGLKDKVRVVDEEGEHHAYSNEGLQIQGDINYAYHRALVTSRSGDTKFNLGALLDAFFNITSALEIDWIAAYSLNASTQVTSDLAPRHFLAFRFYVPFLTYLCRPPWSIYDDPVMDVPEWQNAFLGHITSVHEYVRLTAELRYEYAITDTWRLSLAYEFSFFYVDDPAPMYAVANNFLVGIVPGFGGGK